MTYSITFDRYLDIDGVPMSTPAWSHQNLHELLSGPHVRGQNRVIPGLSGVRPRRRRATETQRTILLDIFGDKDWTGWDYPDPELGVFENIAYLREMVTDPIEGYSTRTATIHMKDLTTLEATIQVVSFEVGEALSPSAVRAAIEITLLDGAFMEVTS